MGLAHLPPAVSAMNYLNGKLDVFAKETSKNFGRMRRDKFLPHFSGWLSPVRDYLDGLGMYAVAVLVYYVLVAVPALWPKIRQENEYKAETKFYPGKKVSISEMVQCLVRDNKK